MRNKIFVNGTESEMPSQFMTDLLIQEFVRILGTGEVFGEGDGGYLIQGYEPSIDYDHEGSFMAHNFTFEAKSAPPTVFTLQPTGDKHG